MQQPAFKCFLSLAATVLLLGNSAATAGEETEEGFVSLFDGKTLKGWRGNVKGYAVEDGLLVCKKSGGGRLSSDKQYADFVLRFDFKLYPGGNNGVALRAPLDGKDPAY